MPFQIFSSLKAEGVLFMSIGAVLVFLLPRIVYAYEKYKRDVQKLPEYACIVSRIGMAIIVLFTAGVFLVAGWLNLHGKFR